MCKSLAVMGCNLTPPLTPSLRGEGKVAGYSPARGGESGGICSCENRLCHFAKILVILAEVLTNYSIILSVLGNFSVLKLAVSRNLPNFANYLLNRQKRIQTR